MTEPSARTPALRVPGARLYCQVSGTGPVLLLIPGGRSDADRFGGLAPLLTDRYTVVRYEPRGISRSRLDGPPEDVPIAVHADDAHRLLLATGAAPAAVVGSSGGGQIGLALVERHPSGCAPWWDTSRRRPRCCPPATRAGATPARSTTRT